MALKNDFYTEIFEQEQKWLTMMNSNLLNVIYCKHSLQPFYQKKVNELVTENSLTYNPLIEQIILVFNTIIEKIDSLNKLYIESRESKVDELYPLFLVNRLTNVSKKSDLEIETVNKQINNLKIRKQVLMALASTPKQTDESDLEYLDDEIVDEEIRQK